MIYDGPMRWKMLKEGVVREQSSGGKGAFSKALPSSPCFLPSCCSTLSRSTTSQLLVFLVLTRWG